MAIKKRQGWSSVQARLTLLMVAAAAVGALALALSRAGEARRIDAQLATDAKEHGVLLDRALELEGASLATFAKDYTNWGEMVRFVQTRDSTWASVNIDDGLSTYRANAAWVFDPAGLPVYAARDSAMETAPEPVAPGVSVKDAFGGGHFCHFFVPGPDGPLEIRGATIHPSDDDERKTPVRGYFLAARLWNKAYLAELTRLTGKTVWIVPAGAGTKPSAGITRCSGEIKFTRPLPVQPGSPGIALAASLRPGWVALARSSGRSLFVQLAVLAMLAVLLLTLVLRFWVTRPLGRIARSLESGTTEALKPLERSRTEFGQLAHLVTQFFGQNAALVQEIAERKQAEAALREAEKIYRDLVDNALVGIFRTTAKGVDEVLYANDTALRICGFKSFEEMKSLRTIVRYKNPGDEQAMMAQLQATGRVTDFEFELRRKDGKSRSVVLNATLDGETLSGMLLDITERKQAEAAVEARSKELARSNAELQNFAFVASHDLQEPLRMVASYTQLLARRYQGKLDEKADKFIAYAVDGAARMQTLVNDLLTYARVETQGKDPAPVECEEALKQALANLQLTIKESGTRITHDPLPEVMGDNTQLVQLFQNLVGNAVKFRNSVSPQIHISSAPADGGWQFSVKDNGIGIDPEQFERIFQIFQRLHTRSEYPGTGIGLALCKRIVERHGGRIWVESQPGQGSTFNFTLLRKEQTNG